jgi:hypothetical protein
VGWLALLMAVLVACASPATARDPAPFLLPAGAGPAGTTLEFVDDIELGSSPAVEDEPTPGARSDVTRPPAGDEVTCTTSLQAPAGTPLRAHGSLEVAIVVDRSDGTSRRTLLQRIPLEVELAAGRRLDLPSSRRVVLDPALDAAVRCETTFTPA